MFMMPLTMLHHDLKKVVKMTEYYPNGVVFTDHRSAGKTALKVVATREESEYDETITMHYAHRHMGNIIRGVQNGVRYRVIDGRTKQAVLYFHELEEKK